ncbi:hypothetical protein DRX19_30085, partial [Salmonella enterica subsp. enterica]|nr:hypothetical protein [Salmonella enterica subsp. enterica serovar Pensacola]
IDFASAVMMLLRELFLDIYFPSDCMLKNIGYPQLKDNFSPPADSLCIPVNIKTLRIKMTRQIFLLSDNANIN